MAARVVDEDAPHHRRRHREEVGAVAPLEAIDIDQPQIRFVDERRGLQRVAGAFGPHVVVRKAVQLVVHDRDERVAGGRILPGPRLQQQ